jgi:chloramphenicol-sensitive protein RarD
MSAPRSTHGAVAAMLAALLLWSLYPFYFRAVDFVPLAEITAHRVVWSALLLMVWAPLGEGTQPLRRALREPRLLAGLAVTGALIVGTWIAYVFAVASGRVQDASLGYFLAPITAVGLGVVMLREPLNGRQKTAVALAAAAVAIEILRSGSLPFTSLALATGFSLYGALRKRLPVPPLTGLAVECLLGLPFALAVLALLAAGPGLALTRGGPTGTVLVLLAGVVTVAPLWLFHLGAKGLPYVTVGILLYVPPSLIFLEAVWLFGEPLPPLRLAAFALVWLALAVHTADAVLRVRAQAPSTSSRGVKGSPRSSATGR